MATFLLLVSFAFAFGRPFRARVRFLILALTPLFVVLGNVVHWSVAIWLDGHEYLSSGWLGDFGLWTMILVQTALLSGTIKLLRWRLYPVSRYPLAHD